MMKRLLYILLILSLFLLGIESSFAETFGNYVSCTVTSGNVLANAESEDATFTCTAVTNSYCPADLGCTNGAPGRISVMTSTCSTYTGCAAREILTVKGCTCSTGTWTFTVKARNQESTTHSGDWGEGSKVNMVATAGQAASWLTAESESDPQVGTLTNTKWCTTDGTDIDCTSDAPLTASSSDTLTNKTFDASGTGNVLKQTGYMQFIRPIVGDGTGAVLQTDSTSILNGSAKFSGSAAATANYIIYEFYVPDDYDNTIELILKHFGFSLDASEGSGNTQIYKISIAVITTSSSRTAPTFGDEKTVTWTCPDGTYGANEFAEITNETLTGWATAIGSTGGKYVQVKIKRDGATDTSTIASYSMIPVVSYGKTQ
jgi:hypothetical protein